jgi:N-dimethylarginine dimethylaminohydrolase
VAPLRAVLLTWPGEELAFEGEPADWLMSARPNLARMREEAEAIAAFYRSVGAAVHWIRPTAPAPPNLVFACDLMCMTPEGAILGRMAAEQRAGEPRWAAVALAEAGVPILATPRGEALLEGADVTWLREDLVLVGLGNRTNEAGLATVGRVLADMGVRVVGARLPPSVQHTLGSINLLDHDLAVAYDATPSLRAVLAEAGYRLLDFVDTPEVTQGRALNFVTVAPREIVMPAKNPRTRARLEAEGVRCHELVVDEYLRAEGGLGCLTGVLARGG